MDNNTLTALATAFLVLVGLAQVLILIGQLYLSRSQKKNQDITVVEVYRTRWFDHQDKFGCLVYLGRELNEYYQTIDEVEIKKLNSKLKLVKNDKPTIWARDAVRDVSILLSDICIRILQGSLSIQSVYPILGTTILRQSLPLRKLLESEYDSSYLRLSNNLDPKYMIHHSVRREVQDWLIYHAGTRRRCLILIDLLWAEAARLQDLPPSDLKSAADAKMKTGNENKLRIKQEVLLLNTYSKYVQAIKLANFLKHSEYKRFFGTKGISKRKLKKMEVEWTERLLENHGISRP